MRSLSHSLLALALLALAGPLAAQEEERPAAATETGDTNQEVGAEDPLRYGREVPEGAVAVIGSTVIPESRYLDELAAQTLRPGRSGLPVLESMIEEELIAAAMERRGITVTTEDVNEKVNALDAQIRRKGEPGGLEEVLKAQEVPLETFRRKIERLVALERLARVELPVPEGNAVENYQLRVWLTQAKEGADIVRLQDEGAELPKGIVARVGETEIPTRRYALELLEVLEPEEAVRPVNVLIEQHVVDAMLEEAGLEVDEEAIETEWEYRKRSFKSDPRMKGIPYDDILRERTGLDPEAFKASREFQIAAGRGLLARRIFNEDAVRAGFEEKKAIYGPVHVVEHVLVRATDDPELYENTKARSKTQALERVAFLNRQLEEGMAFSEIAKQFSEDIATQNSGGRLPRFTPGNHPFEPAFAEAAIALEPGEVSEPVWTSNGWHLIKLVGREPMPELNERIAADLRRRLLADRIRERLRAGEVAFDLHLGQ